ncbi:hypothetical protein BDZ94DRAFT_1255766 [Collybia nuda]|uniref:Phorbol-ester/DAG-type domain-containing protein n=1 Tax=Collybia nuda TaxID=64659 RepID=A0A9P5Y9G2_9AGAR|nr:hypothetical protein BDZ94DRAFT_1255766 [Collybia nuda]
MDSTYRRPRLSEIETNDIGFILESPTSTPTDLNLPSFRVSSSPNPADDVPFVPSEGWSHVSHKPKVNSRARNESRKLFAHVLGQLERRPMPPLVFDAFSSLEAEPSDVGFGALLDTVKDTVRSRGKNREMKPRLPEVTSAVEDDSDDDGEWAFSTDATYDLMLQLKDVLIMSVTQGWHIFDDGYGSVLEKGSDVSGQQIRTFRRSRNSLQPGGRRSRSPSPAQWKQVQAPELLSVSISVLASVVLEDCRYRISSPRPSRPPNALQALSLDIAQYLLHAHRHSPQIISRIGFAMIPAFSTFPPEMHTRLLTFFESVVRGILRDLGQIQGIDLAPVHNSAQESKQNTDLDIENSFVVSIKVDEAHAHPSLDAAASTWSPWSSSVGLKLQSTNAPLQSLSVYYLASLVPPLLGEILECIDLTRSETRPEVLHHLYQLLRLIIDNKVDSYTDLLQVVGYHTPKARRAAASLLVEFWPKAIGHLVIGKPLPTQETTAPQHIQRTAYNPHDHQFTPWRFVSKPSHPSFHGFSHHDCHACSKSIHGFGLLCPFCMCVLHFDCYDYPGGSHLVQYAMISDQDVQRVAMYRFSAILHDPRNIEYRSNHLGEHTFRTVNLFTLCLCIICRKPLWGCTTQAVNCTSCMCFIHSSCLSSTNLPLCSRTIITSEHMNIDWTNLRDSCMDFHRDILQLSKQELAQLSYEDISIFYASMWTQSHILTNGIALGSIVVMSDGSDATHTKEYKVAPFELHRVIEWCEDLLSSNTSQCSDPMDDYIHENHLQRSEHSMVYDWSNLVYISTAIKSQLAAKPITRSSSSDLLNVYQPDTQISNTSEKSFSQPFEIIHLAHLRDVLGHDFNIHSDVAACLILSHLHNVGLFDRLDHGSVLFADENPKEIPCIFPLPVGLDLSTNVETLVSAAEACLSDLDLSVNEVGFLLLVRRLWPNGLASDYALRRLTQMILFWILQEDSTLGIILHDYLAKQKTLPGVRNINESPLWPLAQISRPAPSSFVNNGGDYVATRRALLTRYVIPWLLALHDQDSHMYAKLIYDICLDMEGNALPNDVSDLHMDQNKNELSARCDKVLRSIIKLSQVSIVFTIFDQLFVFWLELTSVLDVHEETMPSLPRLLPREADMSHRSGVNPDQVGTQGERFASIAIDPWRPIIRISSEGREGLSRGLQWLCLLSRSGVEVPVTVFTRFSVLITEHTSSIPNSLLLIKAVLFSTWLQSAGRQELQNVCSHLHDRLAPLIKIQTSNGDEAAGSKSFVRVSLGTCLLLYGCDRRKIIELGMIKESDIKALPSRRKHNGRGSMVVDPIIIDPRLMNALDFYMTIKDDEIASFVAKFLSLFVNDSPYLEPYEVDNFILRNGRHMAAWAWNFYHVQHHEISSIRTSFLLRTLVVDSQPFQEVLHGCFSSNKDWQQRLLCITRLFRIMLDVISPSFVVEGRQWRSSVTVIFYYFFHSIWADEQEEIRVAANAFSSTLLPAHLDAISLCWNEFLAKAPIGERTKLVSFLIQLHPHFPTWKVLSWDAIVEALVEDEYEKNGNGDHSSTNISFNGVPVNNKVQTGADPDMATLRISLLLLSFQMIADGIAVDSFTLLKLKIHLVQVAGFGGVSAIPSQGGHSFYIQFGEAKEIPDLALPCISSLLPVLDAYHYINLSPSNMAGANEHDDRPSPVLVGSIFVDVLLTLFCTVRDLPSLPPLTLKIMLETLCVIIYKHDFESRPLRHLQQLLRRAVLRAQDVLAQDASFEIRQLALSATQAFIKRWHGFMGSIIYTSIESVVKLIASQHHHGQDALTTQAKSFVEATLTTYAQNGLFINLLKRHLDQEFFLVLKDITTSESLYESLLRDVLSRAVESDHHILQLILNNTDQFIEFVFHRGYSAELLLFVGQQLTHIIRKTSDLSPDVFDPSSLLSVFAKLIQNNKINCREMLPYVDTVMRVALNRLRVDTKILSRLIQATAGLLRKHPTSDAPAVNANGVINLIFEILSDALRMKARILPSTLKSMIEAIIMDTPGYPPSNIHHLPPLLELLDPSVHFLQHHVWLDVGSENDFTASLAVGKLIFQLAGLNPSVITKLSDHGMEKSSHTSLSIRAWNIIVLTALLETTENWCSLLFPHLSSFSYAYHAVLQPYAQSGQPPNTHETSTADVNHAFIGLKLWMLLSRKASGINDTDNLNSSSVWNELWPPFEGLIDVFEPGIRAGQPLALATLIISSIADLFIFIRTLHTPIALHISNHISALNRLRSLGHGETTMLKVTRSLRYMLEPPPEISFDVLVNQAAKDVVAAEKLRVLETRVNPDRRALPERHRQTRPTA